MTDFVIIVVLIILVFILISIQQLEKENRQLCSRLDGQEKMVKKLLKNIEGEV